MSICDGCTRRMEMCHTDCADYLAERILSANSLQEQARREANEYTANAIFNGGRRKSGERVYKGRRTSSWKIGSV